MNTPPPLDRQLLQRRLRALLIVSALLLPTFCAFGTLSFVLASQETSIILWMALVIWVSLGALLGVVVARILRTMRVLGEDDQAQ